MKTIVLKSTSAWEAPQGTGEMPTLAETTFVHDACDCVIQIKDRRFQVMVIRNGNSQCDIPEPGKIAFVETTQDLSATQEWNPCEGFQEKIDQYEDLLKLSDERLEERWTDRETIQGIIDTKKADMADPDFAINMIPSGDCLFGRPKFLQNESHPTHNGKSAFHLMTLDTQWGDCGNENYMVALDDEGYPCALFFEASCC